ncbi:MAG: protein-L-isoaspartate(D-aspartate) O-methyltransferase [Nannocystaceae bacterium]
MAATTGCTTTTGPGAAPDTPARGEEVETPTEEMDPLARARDQMVRFQIEDRGVRSPRVLRAMREVPRHRFVPQEYRALSHRDQPLPIGYDVTISQPYIVALMSELADVDPGDRVLEIGTGSGYQAAVLAAMDAEVYTIEIIAPLAEEARALLGELYPQVHTRAGDGYRGWPEHAPYQAIVITAAPPEIPEPLKEQLAIGGRMVVPVGSQDQELMVITRTRAGYQTRGVIPVRFVPMTGEAQER